MKVYKDKQFLVFDFENGKTVKYDFATNTAIGIRGKPVKNLQSQLNRICLDQLFECCVDQQYAKFLRYIEKTYPYDICNIGTILSKVPRYSRAEQYFSAGVEHFDRNVMISYKVTELPKPIVKMAREDDIWLDLGTIEFYKQNPNIHNVALHLDYISLTKKQIYDVWAAHKDSWRENDKQYLNMLINEFGYNAKDLYLYIDRLVTYEAFDNTRNLIGEIYDYANMMNQISPKFDKYPRHFLTTHQIASRNYTRLRKEFPEELFHKRINTKYEISYGEYMFIYPKSTQDIKDEAVQQSNCVASYIDRVIDGKCDILFLRKRNNPEESLVTIEVVNGKIVQARRRFNDLVTEEDQKAIDYFNKKFSKVKEKAA